MQPLIAVIIKVEPRYETAKQDLELTEISQCIFAI